LRRFASDVLLLQRRLGVGKGDLLLLEPPLGPLAGSTLPQELVLSGGERRDLDVEGGLQIVGLLGPLLERARPLLSLALPSLRPLERRAELPVVVRVRVFSRSARACRSASSLSMRAVQTRSRVEGCAGSCLALSWS
jgi:hypothetical protein